MRPPGACGCGGAALRSRTAIAHTGVLIGQHDDRITDLDFGVTHRTVRSRHAKQLGRAKRVLVELDRLRGAFDDEVRRSRVISIWYRFCHAQSSSSGESELTPPRMTKALRMHGGISSLSKGVPRDGCKHTAGSVTPIWRPW